MKHRTGIPVWAWLILAVLAVFLLAKAISAVITLAVAALVVYVVYKLLLSGRG